MIALAGANHITLTLAGVPTSIRILPADTVTLTDSSRYDLLEAAAHNFIAAALDADGSILVGPGAPRLNIGTPSGTLTALTTSASTATTGAPDAFTATPTTTYGSGTASFTVTPTFIGQAADGCAEPGAKCAFVGLTVDMIPAMTEHPRPTSAA